MDILTEDMKKELKEKFKTLDINDEHFQEKAQEIIDEAIVGNKDKIGETVVQKTVDEALEEQKEGIKELNQLIDEGILEKTKDDEARDYLEELATHGIIDEVAEKASLEAAGFLKEPNKATTVEDIVEEILKQLEEVIDEKKRVVEEKIQKNEDMLGKVQKREDLRSARLKVDNLHKKTRNYKGTEGKRFNQNVEAVITDLDKQINALAIATTVDGHELQSDALKEERQKLTEEKQKLEDMFKFLKEKYTKDHAKEGSKAILKSEIKQIMGEVEYGMDPNDLIKKGEKLKKLYTKYKEEYHFTEEELTLIFKESPLEIDEKLENSENAYSLMGFGEMNDIRRIYMNLSNKTNPTDKDKEVIKNCKAAFSKRQDRVEDICDGWEVLPLQTEQEYVEELEGMQEDAEANGYFKGKRRAREVASKMESLRFVLKELISVMKTGDIQKAYAKVRRTLENNPRVEAEDLPGELVKATKQKNVRQEVKVKNTPMPIPHENPESEQGKGEKAEQKTQAGTTQSDDDGYGEL